MGVIPEQVAKGRLQPYYNRLQLQTPEQRACKSSYRPVPTIRHIAVFFPRVSQAKGRNAAEDLETKRRQGELLALLSEYVQNGGYPEIVVKGVDYREYLKMIYNSTLMRDIVRRYRVRATDDLNNIGLYLITNHSAPISMNGVKDALCPSGKPA